MNSGIHRISLDVLSAVSDAFVTLRQGENAHTLEISLTQQGRPYIISTDCTAVFTARKSDGTQLFNNCSIENNIVIYAITAQTTVQPGRLDCEIRLYGSANKLIIAPKFHIFVQESSLDENAVESSDEFSTLNSLIAQARNAGFTVRGFFSSLPLLQQNITSPSAGDAYGVGTQTPYDIYIWDPLNNTWVNNGDLKGSKGDTGEKGDTGDKGDTGSPGVSGVYVGSGEAPASYNVQIDPEGSATELVEEAPNDGKQYARKNKAWAEVQEVFCIHSMSTEDALAGNDEISFYDDSANAHRKTAWSNIKAKLKAYFDTLYTNVVESTVSGWGFTKNTGTYTKPSGGIPASDLAETYVKTSDYNPVAKTSAMTQDVGVDANGKLYTAPGGGGGGTSNYQLIQKIILGYSLTLSEPSDWSTNYTDYFTNTGTAIEPVYTPVTGSSAPTWAANTYYSYSSADITQHIIQTSNLRKILIAAELVRVNDILVGQISNGWSSLGKFDTRKSTGETFADKAFFKFEAEIIVPSAATANIKLISETSYAGAFGSNLVNNLTFPRVSNGGNLNYIYIQRQGSYVLHPGSIFTVYGISN